MRIAIWTGLAALVLSGCHGDHDHGHGHGHGHEAEHSHEGEHGKKAKHGHGHEDDHGDDHGHGEGTAYTTYAQGTELFVEIPNLVLNQPVSLAAHVTHLSDFGPATEGKVVVTFPTHAESPQLCYNTEDTTPTVLFTVPSGVAKPTAAGAFPPGAFRAGAAIRG